MKKGHTEPSPALCAAALRADRGACDALLRAWLPSIRIWASRMGGPGVDREDVAQDVCVVVFQRLHTVTAPELFPAWLYGVTRNIVYRHRRRVWSRRWVPERCVPEFVDRGPGPDRHRERAEGAVAVRAILEKLPAPQREVFVLCEVEEHTQAEAARILQVAPGTVKSRLRLARGRFERSARAMGLYRDARLVRGAA